MKSENQAEKTRYISGITLLRLAAGRSFRPAFAYMLAWDAFLLLCCISGGMAITMCAMIILLMDMGIFVLAVRASFRVKCGWHNVRIMHALLKRKARIHALKKKQLVRRNGAWECADADCFIRVNANSACILFAPEMDFSVPGLHTKVKLYNDFLRKRMFAETKEFHSYVFSLKDKTMLRIQVDRTDSLLKWIAEHGGRTVLRTAFFRSSAHDAAFDRV